MYQQQEVQQHTARVYEIINKNFEFFKNELSILWEEKQYSVIYISIGSKFNYRSVEFPDMLEENRQKQIGRRMLNKYTTNAQKQMIPEFLNNRSTKQLSIVIDDFSNDSNKKDNKNILESKLDKNIDVIMYDCVFDNTVFLKSVISHFMNMAKQYNVNKQNFMICNYVKFVNTPNAFESKSEQIIPTVIQNVIDTNEFSEFADCFYQWFGYRFYIYNFIYRYRNYQTNMSFQFLVNELESFIQKELCDNMKSVAVIQNRNTLHFWKNVYDITIPLESLTSLRPQDNELGLSLYDYLLENELVEVVI